MAEDTYRSVQVERVSTMRYVARNAAGATLPIGGDGFTPVELLLAAIGSCTAMDADVVISRRTEPESFTVTVSGDKISDDTGNRMTNLAVTFDVRLPEGPAGDQARTLLARTVKLSHDRLCTVSRTVELGTPVTSTVTD
ncbi:oxidoreductase [Actinophytocola xinjiangensis]|uniref:Oxidoreductase n=1 Tax=Actinophytocola xinjiangensis TaxID=485602 RepID=A0A7Z0WQF2_9PSEU|nr:OsmC family protein [Actinophytocola xinjiangensis]OLF12212.1 oxidoreductase [Actinophytocola xinjiangensis]